MVPNSTTTLTWGTLAAAVASAAMLVGVGCVMPDIRRQVDDERSTSDAPAKAERIEATANRTSARSSNASRH